MSRPSCTTFRRSLQQLEEIWDFVSASPASPCSSGSPNMSRSRWREPWSSGYGRRLVFRRLWVRLLVLDRHIIFSHIFVVRIVMMFVWKDENKWKEAAGMAHFLKKNETIKIYDQFFWRYYKSGDHRQSVEGLGDGNGWTRDVKLLLRTFLKLDPSRHFFFIFSFQYCLFSTVDRN